jgi:O-antigen ligase
MASAVEVRASVVRLAAPLRRWTIRADWARIAPGLLAASVVATVGIADGGLFPRTWRLATVALLSFASAGLIARERIVVSRLEWAMIAALAGFTGWIALSAAWSEHPESALLEAERSLTYVAALFAIVVLTGRASLPQLLVGLLAGVTIVAAYGLGVYLFTSPPLDPFQGGLLYQPIGYANALGIFAAVGILVSAGLTYAARTWRLRAAALLPLGVLVPTLGLTSSRGAGIALTAGVIALLFFIGHARVGLACVLIVAAVSSVMAPRFASDNRIDYWHVAWRQFEDNPLLGGGGGTYVDYWFRYRTLPSFTRTSHNLYLEALAEFGPVGLALLVVALALPLVAVVRCRDRLVAGAAAAYVAYVLHAALDWDWELPASTLAALVCGAAMLVSARPETTTPLSMRARVALTVPALAVALLAGIRIATGGNVPFGA